MNVVVVSNIPTRNINTAAAAARGVHTASFKDILTSMAESASTTTSTPSSLVPKSSALRQLDSVVVHQGDCLSRICSEQLKEKGSAASPQEIYSAVKRVAEANHIADPDKIYAGQTLDMSVLATSVSSGGIPNAVTVPESTQQWKALVKEAVALASGFGLRKDPFTGQVHQHNGIDVVAPAGAPIHAMAAGSVIFSGWKSGYGNTVIIRHADGLESLYGHASTVLVQVGEWVACHTPIGSVGSTGRATGAHLHFEVRKNGKALNPMALLNGDSLQVG